LLRDLGHILFEIISDDVSSGCMGVKVRFTARTMSCARMTRCLLVRASFTALSCLIFDLWCEFRKHLIVQMNWHTICCVPIALAQRRKSIVFQSIGIVTVLKTPSASKSAVDSDLVQTFTMMSSNLRWSNEQVEMPRVSLRSSTSEVPHAHVSL
jgi:hypothetical protein